MSTVIHNAYRVRTGIDIVDLTARIRVRAERRAKTHLTKLCRAILENPRDFGIEDLPTGSTIHRVSLELRRRYRAQSASSLRDEFDFNVALGVTRVSKRWLLRTFCGDGMAGVLDFVPRMPELEDFHYDNRADRPANVTAREWAQRLSTWNQAVDEHGAVLHQLVVEIVHPSLWHRIAPKLRI